jgi:hypothetical protein
MQKKEDEGVRAVREVRARISAEYGNDPEKLVEHYMGEQERYRDRLLEPAIAQAGADHDRSSRR